MDIRDMNYFLQIAEYENISKAAEELHISQPPLSRQLRKLEEELGVELFTRDNGRLQLTEAGHFFRERAQEVISLVDKTRSQMAERYNGAGGKIRIGTIETLSAEKLPKWVAGFHEIYPDVTYQIVNNNSEEIIRMVDKGLLDMGIVREPVNSQYYERVRLQEDTWIAYIPNRNPLSQKNRTTIEIELADLRDEPLILPSRGIHEKQIKTWFEMIGAEPKVVCWYSSLVNGVSLVKNGIGTMLCPKSAQSILSGLQLCCREGDCESYHDNGIGNRVEELPQSVRVCKKVYRLREVEGDKRITKRIGKITDAIPARYTYADCISARV